MDKQNSRWINDYECDKWNQLEIVQSLSKGPYSKMAANFGPKIFHKAAFKLSTGIKSQKQT